MTEREGGEKDRERERDGGGRIFYLTKKWLIFHCYPLNSQAAFALSFCIENLLELSTNYAYQKIPKSYSWVSSESHEEYFRFEQILLRIPGALQIFLKRLTFDTCDVCCICVRASTCLKSISGSRLVGMKVLTVEIVTVRWRYNTALPSLLTKSMP